LAQLGYGFAYRVLDAQYVRTPEYPRAVPQRRRRVFVVGNLRDARRAAAVLFDSESVLGNPPPSREARKDSASDAREGVEGNGGGIIHASEVSTVDAQNKVDRGDTQHAERMVVQPQWWDGGDSAASLTTRCHDQSMPDKGNFAAIVEPTAFKIRGGSETETGEQGGTPGRKAGKGYLGSEEVTFTIASSQDQHVFYQTQNEVAGTLDASYHKGCGERGGVEREYIAYENHANDSRIKQLDDDVSPSVVARWGTGGNNQALVQKVYESKQHHNPQPTENVSLTTTNCATIRGDSVIVQTLPLNTMTMQGRPSDEGRMGSGIGDPDDPAPTLSKQHSHAVAIRTANTNANGHGIASEVTHTLDQTNSNAVAYAVDVYNQTIDGDVTATLTEACGGTNTSGPKVMAFEPGSIARNAGPAGEDVVCPTLRKEMGDNQPAVRIESPVLMDQGGSVMQVLEDGTVGTLRRETHGHEPSIVSSMQVRRLTPKECERLQGFPDDWTRILWRKKAAEDCPDGPRYKAIGNSMAVNVMQWIGLRIMMTKEFVDKD
jgi:DNA (cytosine-5)-methyltransferase 1